MRVIRRRPTAPLLSSKCWKFLILPLPRPYLYLNTESLPFIPLYLFTVTLTNSSVFYHLGGVDVFHHDSPAFSVTGHLWVDAIDVLFSRSSHLMFGRPLGLVHVTFIFLLCGCLPFASHAHTMIIVFVSGPIL